MSPLAEAALELDRAFAEFERLAGEIERITVKSDKGFMRACQVLTELDTCGQKIGSGLITLTKSLEEVRSRAEQTAQLVAQRANAVQDRRLESEAMAKRFQELGEQVRGVTADIGSLRPDKDAGEEERERITKNFQIFTEKLGGLVDQVGALKQDAHDAQMESFERNADALQQSLQSARHKVSLLIETRH